MKLYLHNFLQDNEGGEPHYPLKIIATEVKNVDAEFKPELMASFVKRIDVDALASACKDIGVPFTAPSDMGSIGEEDLKNFHHLLFEIEVISGELVSPSGRHFPIVAGIPDMCPHSTVEREE